MSEEWEGNTIWDAPHGIRPNVPVDEESERKTQGVPTQFLRWDKGVLVQLWVFNNLAGRPYKFRWEAV